MRVLAPAKINLHLRVGPPTADGFHPLLSWMVTVGLFDILNFTPSDRPGIDLSCDDPAIPTDATNLVTRTATAMLALRPEATAGIRARLEKRIPVGAGLGGGSADGAFTVRALNTLLDLGQTPYQMADLAARFGSDLSFFFHGPSSVCTGRGEVVRPIAVPKPRHALLILPGLHMATPAVYRRFDEMRLGDPDTLTREPDWQHWAALDARALLPHLVNDLEAPAFAISPALADLRATAEQHLARPVRMSGSGSTLFTLFDDPEESEHAATSVHRRLNVRSISVPVAPPSPLVA